MLRLCTNDQVTAGVAWYLVVVNPGALDADTAYVAYDDDTAYDAVFENDAYDAVPSSDPVNDPDMNELDTNNDPVITADPENGKPTPTPPPDPETYDAVNAFNAYDAVTGTLAEYDAVKA